MEPELDGAVGLSGTAGAGNSGMAPKNANSHISFGGFGAGLNPPALSHNLTGQPRPQPPADPYMQQYLMAAHNHSAYPSAGANQHVVYPSSSLQPVASEDDRAYAKYGQSNMNPGANNNHLMRTQSSGPTRTGIAPQGAAPPSNRRPQSALDRPPPSANIGAGTSYFLQPQQGGGDAGGPPGPAGISPGMYTAELRALMGSAAYNRPVSAPQKHHVNAENLTAYQEATQRMKEKDERTKSTKELLESVYKTAPYNPGNGPPRTGSSAALLATTTAPPVDAKYILNPSNSGNIGGTGGGGGRPGSAKWGATSGPPMSAVDRALSIGKGTAAYLPSNRGGDHHAPTSGAPPRERARSAARRDRGTTQQQQDAGRTLPLDNHVKQARLSEMFDEGILDKLDSAIGLSKR